MKRLILTALLVGTLGPVCHAADTAERRALQLAEETLTTVQKAEDALQAAVRNDDEKLYRERFEAPLKRVSVRWQQAPHLTDLDKATHMDCRTAANDLLQYGQAIARGTFDESWKQYALRRYRESLETCKDSIQQPELFRLN